MCIPTEKRSYSRNFEAVDKKKCPVVTKAGVTHVTPRTSQRLHRIIFYLPLSLPSFRELMPPCSTSTTVPDVSTRLPIPSAFAKSPSEAKVSMLKEGQRQQDQC